MWAAETGDWPRRLVGRSGEAGLHSRPGARWTASRMPAGVLSALGLHLQICVMGESQYLPDSLVTGGL